MVRLFPISLLIIISCTSQTKQDAEQSTVLSAVIVEESELEFIVSQFNLLSQGTRALNDDEFNQIVKIPPFESASKTDLAVLREITSDSCLAAIRLVQKLDLTDSILYLVDICNKKTIAELAAKLQYPDGSNRMETSVAHNIATTLSITESLGAYEEYYYEVIVDSVINVWSMKKRQISLKESDSSRIITKKGKYLIQENQAGDFYCKMLTSEALAIARTNYEVNESAIVLEGDSVNTYELHLDGEHLLTLDANDKEIWRIWVYSSKYKTDRGIGVGNSIKEILDDYTFDNFQTEGEGWYFLGVKELDIGLALERGAYDSDDWWSNGAKFEDIPDSIKVEFIIP